MSNQLRFRSDIEGMRAVAVVLVLLYHAQVPWFRGGFLGVDIFFVLSGFLITRSLLTEVSERGKINLGEFYARRVRRLLPASLLVIVATAIGVWALLPVTSWRGFGGDLAASAGYIVNWRFAARAVDYLAEGISASPMQHFWSLAVEEQFYFIWPSLMIGGSWFARRFAWSLGKATALLLGVVVLVPSLLWSVLLTSSDPARAFFVTTTRLWELAVGALCAIVISRVASVPRWWRTGVRAVALVVIVGMAVVIDGRSWPGWLALGPVLAAAALILTGAVQDEFRRDPIDTILTWKPMQKIGAWSYSLYLWHWPPLAILAARWGGLSMGRAVMIVLVSVVPAWLSFRFVENPIRYRTSLRESPRLSLSLGLNLSLIGIVAGLALFLATPLASGTDDSTTALGAETLSPTDTDEDLLSALAATTSFVPAPALATADIPVIYPDGCQAAFEVATPIVCEYGNPDGSLEVAVVGDSKVGQWVSALIDISDRRGWRLITITKSACAFSTALPVRSGEPYPECRDWSENVIDLLAENPPDVVLVSQGAGKAMTEQGTLSRDAMAQGMMEAYRAIEETGSDLVVLFDNPHPGMQAYECVAEHPSELGLCTFERRPRLDSGSRRTQELVVAAGGYESIDMLDLICPTKNCMPVIGGVLVYRQGSHLTATYVDTMARALEERLLSVVLPDLEE